MGLNVTFLSDTHTRTNFDIKLPGGDILIFTGDCMSTGYNQNELDDFLLWLKDQKYTYKICIAGNHDRICESFPKYMVKDIFEKYYDDGVRYLQDEEIEVLGLRIYGTPWQPFFCNWAFNVSDGETLKKIYKQCPEGLDILMSHCPPYGILDKSHKPNIYLNTNGEESLGSVELLETIQEMKDKPKVVVFGHIHGDGGKIEEIDGVKYINASICDEKYIPNNNIISIEM